jgi:hypothetical protein
LPKIKQKMDTLGSAPKTLVPYQDHGTIDIGFLCDAVVGAGVAVNIKAGTAGTVEIANAASDFPFGVVAIGNKVAGDRVTVKTPFKAVVVAKADGAVTHGALVYQSAYTSGRVKVKVMPAAAGAAHVDYAIGVALEAANDAADVTVGLFYQPVAIYVVAGA